MFVETGLRMQDSPARGAEIDSLRRQALAHILEPRKGYKPREAVIRLGEMAEADPKLEQSPDFLEAQILTILARGGKSRRAQKPLFRLFRACLEAGDSARYLRFEEVLHYVASSPELLDGLHFHRTFEQMDQAEVWAEIGRGIAELQALGLECFLNSGTLLGTVRDKKLIAHDDDVDLAIVFEASSPEEAANRWRELGATLGEAKLLTGKQPRNPATLKLQTKGRYNIDLFPAWVQDGQFFVYPYCCGDLAADTLLPLTLCDVNGLPIPQNAESLLAVNYGPGWQSPDPGFAFDWGKANRRFQSFKLALESQ